MKVSAARVNLSFDAAHRVLRHESKCRHLHGHRYSVEVEAEADVLDSVGRVVDFGAMKAKVGAWLDEHLDHATLVNPDDGPLLDFLEAVEGRRYVMPRDAKEPTAENIARVVFGVAGELLANARLRVARVRVWETPNCYAEVTA